MEFHTTETTPVTVSCFNRQGIIAGLPVMNFRFNLLNWLNFIYGVKDDRAYEVLGAMAFAHTYLGVSLTKMGLSYSAAVDMGILNKDAYNDRAVTLANITVPFHTELNGQFQREFVLASWDSGYCPTRWGILIPGSVNLDHWSPDLTIGGKKKFGELKFPGNCRDMRRISNW